MAMSWGRARRWAGAGAGATVAALVFASPVGHDLRLPRTDGVLRAKKAVSSDATDAAAREATSSHALLGTLVQTHSDERIPLDARIPSGARFDALLADRVTGEQRSFDPRLLGLLRALAERHPGCRIELVSGYRSAKLNEMMRKKGHHVASKSQHSLGHAVDFRVVPADADRGIDPRELEKEIRGLGWDGGVGVYTLRSDWFVHADVGRNRRWDG
ncbi:MAG: DUF882 domain-containing protein [Myxococcales bacterium]|nr:DUF882 domain-containing protein [Myxococcales bacterium]